MRVSFLYKQRHAIWQKKLVLILLPIFVLTTLVFNLFITTQGVQAATSSTLNFQGRLLDNTGGLVSDGSYNVEFNLYTVSSGGASEWTETRLNSGTQGVTVQNGYFSVYLGDVTAFPGTINWDQEHWLGMTVRGTGTCAFGACTPTDSEMTPRFKLTAVPYAFSAGAVLDSAGNAYTGDDLVQTAPSTIQTLNAAVAALRLNQTGTGGIVQLQGDSGDVFTVGKTGDTVISGEVTIGTATQTGLLTLEDGGGSSLTLQPGTQAGDLTFTLPANYGVADQCLKTDGTGVLTFDDCPGGSVSVIKTVDEPLNASTLLQNDDELFFDVKANEVWTVEFNLQSTSNSTADYNFAVTAPAGSTCYVSAENVENAQSKNQFGCGANSTNITSQNSNDSYRITATVLVGGTDGTVTLQWAQNTASGTTTVHAGSYLVAREEGLGGGGGGGGGSGSSFVQNGNAFGTTAILGTTETQGLNIIIDSSTALSFSTAGAATFTDDVTLSTGDLTLSGGNLNLGAGDITGSGDITGTAALTLSSGGTSNLTLDSASDVLVLSDSTLRRTAAGTTTLDLLDSGADTTFSISNGDGTRVANLSVEGAVSATSLSGSGSGITNLDGSSVSSGTIADLRLSSNVALLNTAQTFTAMPTFSAGAILGNSTSTTAGAIRWSGTDFEGFDGIQWVSLTPDTSLPLLEGVLAFGKVDSTGTALDIEGATVVRNSTGSYTVTLSTAASSANYVVQLTVEEDSTTRDDINITIDNQATTGFDVTIREGDNGTTADVLRDRDWHFIAFDPDATAGGGGGGGTSFNQSGNAFTATAVLGTTDAYGLNIITNSSLVLSFTSGGDATFANDVSLTGDLIVGSPASPDSLAQTVIFTDATTNKGLVVQGTTSQSASLFELQDNSGNVLSKFDENGGLVLGRSTASNGTIEFNNSTNSNTVTLTTSAVLGTRTISLPDADGTICLAGSDSCGFLELASGTIYTDSTNNDSLAINKTTGTGNLLLLQRSSSAVFTIGNNGALQIQATAATALDIRNAGGTSYLTVDTSTGTTTIDTLAITNGISGAGLADCDTEYDVLQWDSTSGLFSCYDSSPQVIQAVDSSGGTNINTASPATVPFDSETQKTSGFTHDNLTNNSRVTMNNIGWYRISYVISADNTSGNRATVRCRARANGTTYILPSASFSYSRNATDDKSTNTAEFIFQTTAANEYVEILCDQQGSANTINTIASEAWIVIERM